MIEVSNVFPIGKGSLLCVCDVKIVPWKLILKEVKVFEKGANRWVSLPCKEVEQSDGTKKYVELIDFESSMVRRRFVDQLRDAVSLFLDDNPDLQPEDAIKADAECPF